MTGGLAKSHGQAREKHCHQCAEDALGSQAVFIVKNNRTACGLENDFEKLDPDGRLLGRNGAPDLTKEVGEGLSSCQLSPRTTRNLTLTGMRAKVERFTQ